MDNEEKNVNEVESQETEKDENEVDNQETEKDLENQNEVEKETTEEVSDNQEEKVEETVTVESNDREEPGEKKKTYCGLLILFMIISLLLTGYIVYDKTSKKGEEPVNPPIPNNSGKKEEPNLTGDVVTDEPKADDTSSKIKELVKYDKKQVTTKKNVTENGKTYYEVITIKNSDLTVDIKLFDEKDTEDPY